MSGADTEAMRQIRRWLKGEVFNGHTGVPLIGGPRDGRTHIVQLDSQGQPPPRLRTSGAGAATWFVYVLVTSVDGHLPHRWTYQFAGTESESEPPT